MEQLHEGGDSRRLKLTMEQLVLLLDAVISYSKHENEDEMENILGQ